MNSKFILKLSPNPASDECEAEISVIEDGNTELYMYNTNGEVVKRFINKYLSANLYKMTLDMRNISSGFYFLVLNTNSMVKLSWLCLLK